jgi:hypothetical protein
MDSPHCGVAFHDEWASTVIRRPSEKDKTVWSSEVTRCPACREETIRLLRHDLKSVNEYQVRLDFRVYPRTTHRKPIRGELPSEIKEDYEEACMVLPSTNKASAALSRRCLQAILRGQGYPQKDLAKTDPSAVGRTGPRQSDPNGAARNRGCDPKLRKLLSSPGDGSDHPPDNRRGTP